MQLGKLNPRQAGFRQQLAAGRVCRAVHSPLMQCGRCVRSEVQFLAQGSWQNLMSLSRSLRKVLGGIRFLTRTVWVDLQQQDEDVQRTKRIVLCGRSCAGGATTCASGLCLMLYDMQGMPKSAFFERSNNSTQHHPGEASNADSN